MTAMDDLRARFRRIDRLEAPDLWVEAVNRSSATDLVAGPRPLTAAPSLLIAGLLLALLAGVVAVGMSQRPQVRVDERILAVTDCALVLIAPEDGTSETLVGDADRCVRGQLQVDAGGDRVAITTDCGNCFGLSRTGAQWAAVIDVSTGAVRELDACAPDEGRCLGDILISPDGGRVAYARWEPGADAATLVVADLDSGERRTVPLHVLPWGSSAWTPDGEAVIVSAPGGDEEEVIGRLYRVPFSGEPEVIVEAPGEWPHTIDVSPDGRSVAFVVGQPGDAHEVRRAAIDGSDSTVLARGIPGSTFIGVSWSPDSARIAVTEVPTQMLTGPLSVQVVDVADGTSTTAYRTDEACCVDGRLVAATWFPEGDRLRFAAVETGSGMRGALAVPADGSGAVELLTEEWPIGWVPAR